MLEEDLAWCKTLPDVQHQTQSTLREDDFLIHYVAGPISCDGEENIPHNIDKLFKARTDVMHALGNRSLVFTAPFIFSLDSNHNSYNRLGLFDIDRDEREAAMQDFWDQLLTSGLIDGVHFVDGWQRSPGARREHLTATENDIPAFYL